MNFMGANWDIIFNAKNYFIPCLIFLFILIAFFIKYREIIFLLGICMMFIGIFIYSPWGRNINSIVEGFLMVISFILASIITGLSIKHKKKR